MSCGGVEGGNDSERLARENRERERDYRAALKQRDEEMRRNQAARAEAQRQRDAEATRRQQAQTQARANERSDLESKIRAAIYRSGALVQYIDSQACQSIFTNTSPYWITVVWDYTVTIEKSGPYIMSSQQQAAFELPPGQTQAWPISGVYGLPACTEEKWTVPGGAITRKDNLNNYPYHLR